MSRVAAILMDPDRKWVTNWPGPLGGWMAILDCDHEFGGKDLDKRPVLGDELLCIECRREEVNRRRRNG